MRCIRVATSSCPSAIWDFRMKSRCQNFFFFFFLPSTFLQGLCPALQRNGGVTTAPSHRRGWGMGAVGERSFVGKLWDTNQVCLLINSASSGMSMTSFLPGYSIRGWSVCPFHMYSPSLISTYIVSRGQHLLLSHSSPWDAGCLLHFTVCKPW